MSRFVSYALFAVVAGGLLAGCRSAPLVPAPDAEPTPEIQSSSPTDPVQGLPPPSRVDGAGNPLDAAGQPLGRIFYFEFDQARLSEADLRSLAMHATFLRDFRDRRIVVSGHCDERGTREYNLALGERRANAVQRYLVSAGVRSEQIQTVSFGEERPADPGHDERAWALNRRAVLDYR